MQIYIAIRTNTDYVAMAAFHARHGRDVTLSCDATVVELRERTVEELQWHPHSFVVFSSQPLQPGVPFVIRIEETIVSLISIQQWDGIDHP